MIKNISEIINERHSTRNYSQKKVSEEIINDFKHYAKKLENPFKTEFDIHIINEELDGSKIGTYGFIKGASQYIGISLKNDKNKLLSAGYIFEDLILYLTSKGISTCILGGTFKKSDILQRIKLKEDFSLILVSPIGYGKPRTIRDKVVRFAIGAKNRKNFENLFFDRDFETPLYKENAGKIEEALEFVRVGPSAVNRQPWRILKINNDFHFYIDKVTSDKMRTLKIIDNAIAIRNFTLGLIKKNIEYTFLEDRSRISDPKYVLTVRISD